MIVIIMIYVSNRQYLVIQFNSLYSLEILRLIPTFLYILGMSPFELNKT